MPTTVAGAVLTVAALIFILGCAAYLAACWAAERPYRSIRK